MSRHSIRYWFFRFRTEEDGGAPAEGAPPGLKQEYEGNPHFGGWSNFGVTWDVDATEGGRIVPLRVSLESRWNSEAWANARPMPEQE